MTLPCLESIIACISSKATGRNVTAKARQEKILCAVHKYLKEQIILIVRPNIAIVLIIIISGKRVSYIGNNATCRH